jgi:hypothetical protein
MKSGRQLRLFDNRTPRKPESKSLEPQSAPRLTEKVYQNQDDKLKEMNLRYGAAYVYRDQGKFYAWGDFTHCPREDIEHNIQVLTQMLIENPTLTYIGKSYQADIYCHKDKVDWARELRQIRKVYGEKLFKVTQQGKITSEAVESDHLI